MRNQAEYHRAYRQTPDGKQKTEDATRRYRKTPAGKAVVNKMNREYRKRNRLKKSAHDKVKHALKSGKLVKGVCHCGRKDVHAHHDDYTKPLDVTWLCPTHHREHHKQ